MPPEAISRSRTYLPKIWGNTRRHRTALWAPLLALGCGTAPGPVLTHSLRAHFLPGCGVDPSESVQLDLTALGDFDPSPDTFDTLDEATAEAGIGLSLPLETRALVAFATSRSRAWSGVGLRDVAGDLDLTLWPGDAACEIAREPAAPYPGGSGGQAVGLTGDGRTLLVAGDAEADKAAGALAVDLANGTATKVPGGLRAFRTGPTITPFGSGLLVAGGSDPDSQEPLGTAEVFDPATTRFEAARLPLERPRARHAAVTLASGETLLVGGESGSGQLVRTLEAVSPETRLYRIDGLSSLETPRNDPVALRLSDDRILVAGGTDAAGNAVESLEWLSVDAARTTLKTPTLSSGANGGRTRGQAFAAMPGGGVLVAGGCEQRALPDGDDRAACTAACGEGSCPSRRVQWITPDGAVATLAGNALDVDAPHPALVRGSDGRPWLFTDVGDGQRDPAAPGGAGAVRRFDPFLGRFTEVAEGVPAPTSQASQFVRMDAGLFLWLDRSSHDDAGAKASVWGFRHGTRTAFSADVSPLLSADRDGVALDRDARGVFENGTVTLAPGGATLTITDTTYADVHLAIAVANGAAPAVALGARTFGGAACPWPATPGTGAYTARLGREGDRVRLEVGAARRDCVGPSGRVTVVLAAGSSGPAAITSLTVARGASMLP